MNWSLAESYRHCQRHTRRAGSSFYYAILTLPRAKRRAMCALYAFMRHTDDLGDGGGPVESRRAALERWRVSLDRALAGQFDEVVLPAVVDSVARYGVPPRYLFEAIDGVLEDLDHAGYETFEALCGYCHKVASVVGLACLHIWGFESDAAIEPARKCGLAFQLTNILRDLKEDTVRGRVYLPREDLQRFQYTAEELIRGVRDDRFRALMRFEVERAEALYREAAVLAQYLSADGKTALGAMTAVYRELLAEIRRRDGDVFADRVRVAPWRKLLIAGRWMLPRPFSAVR